MRTSGSPSGRQLVREWLVRSCLNQKEAALRIGVTPAYLSEILGGTKRPGLDNAVWIERVTGVPVEAWVPTRVGGMARTEDRTCSIVNVCGGGTATESS